MKSFGEVDHEHAIFCACPTDTELQALADQISQAILDDFEANLNAGKINW